MVSDSPAVVSLIPLFLVEWSAVIGEKWLWVKDFRDIFSEFKWFFM